jgi:transposase
VKVTLTNEQRAELQRRTHAATSTQREARRARIVLACEEGDSADAVARRVGVDPSTVYRWRSRFVRMGLEGLDDQPRPGHPSKFGPLVRLQLVALACEPASPPSLPPQAFRTRSIRQLINDALADGKTGYSVEELQSEAAKRSKVTFTLDELVLEAKTRGIVEQISRSSYQRILAQLGVKPHRVQGWIHSPDPQFREKVNEITELYLHPPTGSVVLSIDEKTGMQALERRFPDRPPQPGRLRRREYEYKRHGTQALLCAFDVHTGRVVAECQDTRTGQDLIRFMERVAEIYPTGLVHVVWDNLNIHFDGKDKRWTTFNERHGHRFVFHYTPKHASWVNQVELFFSILQRKVLHNASFLSKEELRLAVLGFIDRWNREMAHPFRWTFTGYPLQAGAQIQKAA